MLQPVITHDCVINVVSLGPLQSGSVGLQAEEAESLFGLRRS